MYIMRIQEIGSDKVTVVTAEGKLTTIIKELGLLKIHVIQYLKFEKHDKVVLTKPSPRRCL